VGVGDGRRTRGKPTDAGLNSGRTGRTGHSEGASDACVFFADDSSSPEASGLCH